MRKITLFAIILLVLPSVFAADKSAMQEYTIYNNPMDVGVKYTVDIGFQNTGDTVWTKAAGYEMVVLEAIGSYCSGTELSPSDSVAGGQVKVFELSCTPLMADVGKTTIRVQMQKSGVLFGDEGVIDIFTVEDNCKHGAVDKTCNKYCGSQEECDGYPQNYINKNGFCDAECVFSDAPPVEFTTTTATTTIKRTTTTTTTTTTTEETTTTTTIKCTLTAGLRDDGVCSVMCGASSDCDLKTVDLLGCANCGVKQCGNGLLDRSEECDTSAKNWVCEPIICNGTKSKGFINCNNCRCAYYDEACTVGRCNAECSKNTDCNDQDEETDDFCSEANCICYHEPVQEGAGSESKTSSEQETVGVSTQKGKLRVFIFLVVILTAVTFVLLRSRKKEDKK